MAEPAPPHWPGAGVPHAPVPNLWWLFLAGICAIAVIAGAYSRFRGLGSAPLAVDEYYLLRSTDNVLRGGWPEYACGGWYTRGVLVQYVSALMRLGGLSPVVAPRTVCALSSLLALPAVYTLGRRAGGATVGLLAVILIALSVWEIEIGRFGRMYAPFQTAFLWYLVFFVRFTVDGSTRALWAMAILTCVAPLLWEGGALLGLTNFLGLYLRWLRNGRLSRSELSFLAAAVLLFVASYLFVTTDFRTDTDSAAVPPNYNSSMETDYPDVFESMSGAQQQLRFHPLWLVLALLPLASAVFALRYVWDRRKRPICAAGLTAAVVAALLGQFAAAGVALVLLLVLGQLTWRELWSRQAALFWLALGVCAAYWLCFTIAVLLPLAPQALSPPLRVAVILYQFLRFPDLIDVAVRPWSRAVPILGTGLILLLAVAVARQGGRESHPFSNMRVLLATLLFLLCAASVASPPRLETRYLFFLYPLALIVAIGTVTELCALLLPTRQAVQAALGAAAVLGAFALTEDFQPQHLLHIDSHAAALREDLSPGMASHLIAREDTPAIERWLESHAGRGDLVISSYHSLDYYYPRIDYFYTDWHDPGFAGWSCAHGRLERWTNLPLLYTPQALQTTLAASRRTFLVLFDYQRDQLLPLLAPLRPEVSWSGAFVSIITVHHP